MIDKKLKRTYAALILVVTILVMFPLVWMFMLSLKSNSEILTNPAALPSSLNFENFRNALDTLDYVTLYKNTGLICILALALELICTFFSASYPLFCAN